MVVGELAKPACILTNSHFYSSPILVVTFSDAVQISLKQLSKVPVINLRQMMATKQRVLADVLSCGYRPIALFRNASYTEWPNKNKTLLNARNMQQNSL